jgi:hypothetical protein
VLELTHECVFQLMATLSILTNSGILGVTSYGLYFYFPSMTIVESLWCVLVRSRQN